MAKLSYEPNVVHSGSRDEIHGGVAMGAGLNFLKIRLL